MIKVAIGIDNGISGTIGILIDGQEPIMVKTPTKSMQDYTKEKKNITRIDVPKLYELLEPYSKSEWVTEEYEFGKVQHTQQYKVHVCMERPMVNPGLWRASESAMRAFEVTWAVVEMLGFPHSFCASTDWQKELLPKNLPKKVDKNGKLKGYDPEILKKASLDIGNRLFPQFIDFRHPDRDGILIAEWIRQTKF